MHLHALPYAEVKHDLLATTGNGISPDIPVQPLDLGALPAARVTQAAKDLTRLPRAELKGHGGLGLERRNGAAELEHGLRLAHGLALVDDVLEPRVRRLDLARHVGELEADDGVVDELLAEGAALGAVLYGFFVADAREAEALDDDADALVVEVGHDDWSVLVVIPKKMCAYVCVCV